MSKSVFPVQQINRRKIRTALIGQGQRMSNWLYNMKQSSKIPGDIREEMRRLQEEWDRIVDEGKGDTR
jgi:hypothetical protein